MPKAGSEVVIDFSSLVRASLSRWPWLVGALVIGVLAGNAVTRLVKPKYSSRAIFVPEKSGGMGQNLQALGMLTGKLGLSGEGSEPPYISHFEDFLKTRNFFGEMREQAKKDSSLDKILKERFGKTVMDTDSSFFEIVSGLVKPEKKNELYTILANSPDPELSVRLAETAFRAFDEKLNATRLNTASENLQFIGKLTDESRHELELRSDELSRFQSNNRDASSPNLEKIRQGLILNLKLAEEKYTVTMKEYETAKVDYEKKEESLVLIEKPYFEPDPVSPKPVQYMAGGGFLFAFAMFLSLAVRRRKDWIGVGPGLG